MKKKIILLVLGLVVIGLFVFLFDQRAAAPVTEQKSSITPTPLVEKPTPVQPVVSFNKKTYSTTDPTSPWVIVNKVSPIEPTTYSPADLKTLTGGGQIIIYY